MEYGKEMFVLIQVVELKDLGKGSKILKMQTCVLIHTKCIGELYNVYFLKQISNKY